MNWLIFLFGSGVVFFLGIGLILSGVAACVTSRRDVVARLATLAGMFGLILIALSATPLTYWLYALAGTATFGWLATERAKRDWLRRQRVWLRCATAVAWTAAVAVELPYHQMPTVPTVNARTLAVIGDSVSAGLKDNEETWPCMLAQTHGIEVTNLADAGARVGSALRQVERLPTEAGFVLLEIGGNDLLGFGSASEFAAGLDKLLARICRPGRVVLMFELPLPPFHNDFGLAQRRLAARYGVLLIPKRIFASVITGGTATLDSIHLSPDGHALMADAVWRIVEPTFGP